ncbi:hypothetical protein H1230_09160 [Paenibacillus sp. 19GGS1-52]|uniref:hypothetical protein n=1 Tax=Paenibacillus sp. 19GGS1-52 TaxID=2758563 RepID=UPI001EFB2491|nr:hypothetical protein [Paenibacillus sp. 19GGS1-52]ULO08918.1 hypothetical protein H1230_09160 [Paenibacillus sp. 19GGS1-52]
MSTLSPIHPKAVSIINDAIKPLLINGCKIESLQLYVCYQSEIAQHETIETEYGALSIRPSNYIPKGFSYVREDPGQGFSWVTIVQSKERKAI